MEYTSAAAEFAEGSVDWPERGATGMCRAMERSTSLLILLLMAGCCGIQETRFLSCAPRDPSVEAQSYNLHDPFPDEHAGPNTFTRPRAFIEPRSDTRKNFDLRFLKAAYGFPQQRYSSLDTLPTGGASSSSYPVQPLWRTPQSAPPIATGTTW